MNNLPFPGFPPRSSFTPIPNLFFSRLLTEVDSLAELRLILHVMFCVYQKRGALQFVRCSELLEDCSLMAGIADGEDAEETMQSALLRAIERGVLVMREMKTGDKQGVERIIFVNNQASIRAADRLCEPELSIKEDGAAPYTKQAKPNIFELYEQNIGVLTPMIAEDLKDAVGIYPADWIEEAFREAVSLNRRSWRYISKILERWSIEGRESGESRTNSKEARTDPDRYVKGKYGHLVRR